MDGKEVTFAALILAAGEGSRLNSKTPKPWIEVEGDSLLSWSLRRLEALPGHIGSVVALDPVSLTSRWPALRNQTGVPRLGLRGGSSRQESARRAFEALEAELGTWPSPDVVLVHDAARPFFPREATRRLVERAFELGGALLAFPVRDTLKSCDPRGRVLSTVPREGLYAAATPQAFALGVFREMLTQAAAKGIQGTDEAMLAEALGLPLEVVPCPSTNLKITYPEDLALLPCLAPLLTEDPSR